MVAEDPHSEPGALLDFLLIFSALQVTPEVEAAPQSPVGTTLMSAAGRTSS